MALLSTIKMQVAIAKITTVLVDAFMIGIECIAMGWIYVDFAADILDFSTIVMHASRRFAIVACTTECSYNSGELPK
jgi:hypothetical protein